MARPANPGRTACDRRPVDGIRGIHSTMNSFNPGMNGFLSEKNEFIAEHGRFYPASRDVPSPSNRLVRQLNSFISG
jgi:hypothetical protein